MPTLTEFQHRCEEALSELLEYRSSSLSDREIVGNGETYIHATIADRDLEVWIYDDEAEYRSGPKRRNFEAAVFRDESERIASFIKEVQAELDQ